MGLIWVTGICGAGKSAVRAELRQRGYDAYGTDEDSIARWVNIHTGAIGYPNGQADRTPQFAARHDRRADTDKVAHLARMGEDHPVILCGSVGNEVDVRDLFTMVVLLSVDEQTMRHRLATRTTNDFGKNPHELAGILGWRKTIDEDYRRLGATIIDATRPVGVVVDDILRRTGVGEMPAGRDC